MMISGRVWTNTKPRKTCFKTKNVYKLQDHVLRISVAGGTHRIGLFIANIVELTLMYLV